MHDGGLSERQAERAERHVIVQEASLVDQPEHLGLGHGLLAPVCAAHETDTRRERANREVISHTSDQQGQPAVTGLGTAAGRQLRS